MYQLHFKVFVWLNKVISQDIHIHYFELNSIIRIARRKNYSPEKLLDCAIVIRRFCEG